LQNGVGTATCGPGYLDKYIVWAKQYSFGFSMKPFDLTKTTPKDLLTLKTVNNTILPQPDYTQNKPFFNEPMQVTISSKDKNALIKYTLDGTEPTEKSMTYSSPILLEKTTILKAKLISGKNDGFSREKTYKYVPVKTVTYADSLYQNNKIYDGGSTLALFDGIRGDAFNPGQKWVAFKKSTQIDVELSKLMNINQLSISIMQDRWAIFLPEKIRIETSTDGKSFAKTGETVVDVKTIALLDKNLSHIVKIPVVAKDVKFVRIYFDCLPIVPEWHNHKGKATLLFLDEIWIE